MNGTVERCVLDVLGIPDLLGWQFQNELAARYMQELAFVQCLFAASLERICFLAHRQDFRLPHALGGHHEKSLRAKVGNAAVDIMSW